MKFYKKWKGFLNEAERDAKVLRNINIDHIKKEEPQAADEEVRDYFARLQKMERDPNYLNPIFPQQLVSWIESLPDNHFPTSGRKRFAKWLGNSIYFEETDGSSAPSSSQAFEDLNTYSNDIRYIVDYLNGSRASLPKELWNLGFYRVFDLATQWHDKFKDSEDPGDDYKTMNVVYDFENGYKIVQIPAEDIETEGEKMNHCVGSYCDAMERGEVIMFSLRNRNNEPHATVEVDPEERRVLQIKGNSNSPPKEEYRPMLSQWLATTELDYKDSPDYLNLLTSKEIRQKLQSGELPGSSEANLAASSEDSEIIDFMIDQLSSAETVLNINRSGLANHISRNRNLNEDQRFALIKINMLGEGEEILQGAKYSLLIGPDGSARFLFPPENIRVDFASLSRRTWSLCKEVLNASRLDVRRTETAVFTVKAVCGSMYTEQEIRDEILEYLLSEEYMNKVAKSDFLVNNLKPHFMQILQKYLDGWKPPNREIVRKIYSLRQNVTFLNMANQAASFPLNGYIVQTPSLSDDIVEQMMEDVKNNKPSQLKIGHVIDAILNPAVSDLRKIELLSLKSPPSYSGASPLSVVDLTTIGTLKGPYGDGPYWGVTGRRYSRELVKASEAGAFSKEFMKYMIDAGIFDPEYATRWIGQYTKRTGKSPNLAKMPKEEYVPILSKVREEAKKWLDSFEPPKKEYDALSEPKPPWVSETKDPVSIQVAEYFNKKTMTKDKFYDSIKESLKIKEEKGRSRQRGIYKFYCMLSYSLTIDQNRSRGLDDILADLRALPNVTIVTVVIKNQKVAEGRYIAGLSIKFIPSVPGQFSSPEDSKSRILRDLKRLKNVQNIFKVSAGFERLE
tara:strand:+ start:6426 stop:8966 length:2541 start_codon:yes stop_codon:yes gene_type:complete